MQLSQYWAGLLVWRWPEWSVYQNATVVADEAFSPNSLYGMDLHRLKLASIAGTNACMIFINGVSRDVEPGVAIMSVCFDSCPRNEVGHLVVIQGS